MEYLGIDLAGSESRRTGFAVLDDELHASTLVLGSDSEILAKVAEHKAWGVGVDAPLSLPKGRCCLSDQCSCKRFGHVRQCERELRGRGIPVLPLDLGPMRQLTQRGIKLGERLEEMGVRCFEVYPRGAKQVLDLVLEKKPLELQKNLVRLGFTGSVARSRLTMDELDAVCSAYVVKLFHDGLAEEVGDPEEGVILMPSKRCLV